jgi:uncharacterized damage-inducible protein DinB
MVIHMYVNEVLHQLSVAVESSKQMLEQTPDELLDWKPADNKRTIREMFVHLAILCKADYYIMNGYSREEMEEFYLQAMPYSKQDIKENMMNSFSFLSEKASAYTETQLSEKTASYWGAIYTRFGWLLEILAHFYHHRGQIHAYLTGCGFTLDVRLFE